MENITDLIKSDEQIVQFQKLLVERDEKISNLQLQRFTLGMIAILLLGLFIWAFFINKPKATKKIYRSKNFTLVGNDSLRIYRESYFYGNGAKEDNSNTSSDTSNSLSNEEEAQQNFSSSRQKKSYDDAKVVYSVQIAAKRNFNLSPEALLFLTEIEEGGYNKFLLGNYLTFSETKNLRDELKTLGFDDCFIVARSYGKSISLKQALLLSKETADIE